MGTISQNVHIDCRGPQALLWKEKSCLDLRLGGYTVLKAALTHTPRSPPPATYPPLGPMDYCMYMYNIDNIHTHTDAHTYLKVYECMRLCVRKWTL